VKFEIARKQNKAEQSKHMFHSTWYHLANHKNQQKLHRELLSQPHQSHTFYDAQYHSKYLDKLDKAQHQNHAPHSLPYQLPYKAYAPHAQQRVFGVLAAYKPANTPNQSLDYHLINRQPDLQLLLPDKNQDFFHEHQ